MTPTYTDNERAGRPSASIVERLWLCPGSWRMSRGLPELVTPEMRKYAQSGDRIHLWLQAPDFVDLSAWPDELETAQQCLVQLEAIKRRLFAPGDVDEAREKRFWLHDQDGQKRFSAKLDYAGIQVRTGLVVDYKSNRGDVTESPRNMQLRAQAVLLYLAHERAFTEIYTAIVQPLVSSEPELCRYSETDLRAAESELEGILRAADDPKAPVRAGEKQCKFCPARLRCPAAVDVLKELADFDATRLVNIAAGELAWLLEKADAAETVMKAARAYAKALMKANADAVPGWSLKPNSPIRSIKDPMGVYVALFQAGYMTQEAYIKECVSVGVGDLEKAVASLNKLKAKDAKAIVNQYAEPFLEFKPKEPSLEKRNLNA